MNNRQKMNLRKLSFLGFKSSSARNDGSSNDGEVQLDEECAKVFAMDNDVNLFDINKFHDVPAPGMPRQYGEKEYTQHRKRSYPHMHAPLKLGSKSMRRRSSSQTTPSNSTPLSLSPPRDTDDYLPDSPSLKTTEAPASDTPLSSVRSRIDSDTGQLNSDILEETDEADSESESECVLSDPCSYRHHDDDDEVSPERKVSFINEIKDQFDVNGLKEKKKRRHHHTHHPKFRKFSLPDDPSKRHHHHHHRDKADGGGFNKNRRVSTQPEDETLCEPDLNQLESHRSDNFRRHRSSRPSQASILHIGKGAELHPSLKKLYDHSPHAIFVELDELFTTVDEREWKETARWIKYEEDVEEGVDRWGKPHVASLSFHSLLNLRKCLEDGVVLLDMEERDLPAVAYRVTEELFREEFIREEDKGKIIRALLLRHRHVNEHHERGFRFPKKQSYTSLQNLYDADKRKISYPILENLLKNGDAENFTAVEIKEETYATSNEDVRRAHNDTILRKIPAGAQGSSVLVGEVDFLEQPAIAFVRLAEGVVIPSLIEVNIPVRFIFILLGPKLANIDYHEVGRSISTLMANQQFHNIAYGANNRKALLSAINEFLDDSIVLPPGDWERQALLPIEEIKAKSDAIRRRKENALQKADEARGITKPLITQDGEKKPPYPNPLERTRKPWGGLINDLKRRYPHYLSDLRDGLNAQCAAASIFMYFAAVSGAIAFGGLLGDKTQNLIGIPETLLSTSVAGLAFALLAGQPLVIIGTTGGLLLFDESLFQFCTLYNMEFLTTRVYISIWLALIGLVVACLEGSVFVKLFTRFTEDIFSALIVLLYILESIMKVIFIYGRHPLLSNYCEVETLFFAENGTDYNNTETVKTQDDFGPVNQANTALFCTILTLGTFIIAYYLKMFRNSQFLGRSARRALGDFGVPIAIIMMVFVDYMTPEVFTEKLNVPQGLSPSEPEQREWFISPDGRNQPFPVWVMFASAIPALLVYILLFMETHITELIIDKKERKLKKGSGFHLDIVLVCLINLMSGFFGMPWLCAATVRSIAHVSALTVMSRTHAPGEKPYLVEVKEQRMSAFCVALLIGLSVLMAPLLRLVPMAVLFGIFLYMGVASIDGIQFFDRIKLLFMPVKHHPNTTYVRRVRTAKMHLFTCVQLMCLVVLWVVKSTKASLAFPFFLILMVPLRAQLKHIFTPPELRALDGDQVDVEEDEPDFYAEAPLPG
ncbi:unnamed protein product [Brassicogethes aeneus]|uniref:Anion exchange protein n=1 Tax=Brassicogethes aeneus TaxID=1431903 RepID=A0A9P0AN02_BRAAE|nr:unnamed protein product [Brassicogethes aeneus]